MLPSVLASQCRAQGYHRLGTFTMKPKVLQPQPQKMIVRRAGEMLPPSQYDGVIPRRLYPTALVKNWELVPLVAVTSVAVLGLLFNIFWACKNKVDVVFSTHSINNISHTMNLRKPTTHKLIIINQRYEPWPEMQDVLDKMLVAEHRALLKATRCSYEVDVVFQSRCRRNISRTMDLRNPSVHKMIIINQRYEPWPEMQKSLNAIRLGEKRFNARQQECFPIKKRQ